MSHTLKLDLVDMSNNSKITSKTSLTEFNTYLKKRGLGSHGGTVVYFNDCSIVIDAKDYQGHHIKGSAIKVV